jgi:ribosomal protein S14
MRARSPHHADVFSQLPSRLIRELDSDDVAAALDALVAAGWRPGQLRSRVGAEPSQGSVERDAAWLRALLVRLRDEQCPDVRYARERAEQGQERARQRELAPRPADPEVRDRWIGEIRAGLKSTPPRRRTREPQPRTRPECALCGAESTFFVRRDVHLCRRCVDLLATGEVRLAASSS